MQIFLKILDGMANNVDLDQTAPRRSLIWVYTVCICHFFRIFGVRNFMTFTVLIFFIFLHKSLCYVLIRSSLSEYYFSYFSTKTDVVGTH